MASTRPLVSIILLSYNQEKFVLESAKSLFAQEYDNLEILLSDDHSTDRTFELLKAAAADYRGPHTILVNRNDRNLGLAEHINRAWNLTHGNFVVLQAGDDVARTDRVARLAARWSDRAQPVDLVCSAFSEIDENGTPTGRTKTDVVFTPDVKESPYAWRCGATGACAGYSRSLMTKYGPLDSKTLSEDWVLSFRAWLESGIAKITDPLLAHRTHGKSISMEHKAVRALPKPGARQMAMRRNAESALAIARDWQRSALINGSSFAASLQEPLARLVELRRLQVAAYGASRWEMVGILRRAVRLSAGGREIGRLMLRHVLRIV